MRARSVESSKVIGQLREAIAAGFPWRRHRDRVRGFFDLFLLLHGTSYGFGDFVDEDDQDSERGLWEELRDDFLLEHVKRRPGTRPHAWWKWDAPEPRRAVGRDIDEDEQNGHDDGRLPAAEDPNLPTWVKGTYFGAPSVYDGHRYESQREYLERLGLLTDDEKKLFAKFGKISFVTVSAGVFGQCESCWVDAKKIATEIGFDLDGAILPQNTFWLPEDLIFDCDHKEYGQVTGIFSVDYVA